MGGGSLVSACTFYILYEPPSAPSAIFTRLTSEQSVAFKETQQLESDIDFISCEIYLLKND